MIIHMKKITMFLLMLLSMCMGVQAEEVTLSDTPVSNSSGDGYPILLSDGGTELKNAGAHVGQEVRFYATIETEGEFLQLWEGHWKENYLDVDPADISSKGYFSLKLTQEILDAAYEQQNWGGTFLINTDYVLTITKITLADIETVSGLSLVGWGKWDDGIILTNNTDGSLTIDFNTVDAWKGTSKWLGGYDASDYDYLVFEIAPLSSGSYDVQTYLQYAEGEAETMWWTLDESKRFLRLPLDPARKNAINQVAFQNTNNEGVPFTVKEAYWVSKIDFAELNSAWYNKDDLEVADRTMFINYDNFDYMVFEFSSQTTEALDFLPKYGGTLNGEPWWVSDSESDKVTTDVNLVTAFVPLTDATIKELYYMGYTINKAGSNANPSTQPSKVYVATKDYLLEQGGFTEEQLANHIYVPAGRWDLDISHDGGIGGDSNWGWNEFRYTGSTQTITSGMGNSGGSIWNKWDYDNGNVPVDDYDYVVVEFAQPTDSYMLYLGGSSIMEGTAVDKYCTQAVWKYSGNEESLTYIGIATNEACQVKIKSVYLATEAYVNEHDLKNEYKHPETYYVLSRYGQPEAPSSEYDNYGKWTPASSSSTLDWQFNYDEVNEFEPDEYDYLVFRFTKPTTTRTAQIKVSSGSYSFAVDIASEDESLTCRQKVVKVDDEGLWEQFFETGKWIEHISIVNPTAGEQFQIGYVELVKVGGYTEAPQDIYEPNIDLTDFVEIPLNEWMQTMFSEITLTEEENVYGDTHPVLNVTAAAQTITDDGEVKEGDFEVDYGYAPGIWFRGNDTNMYEKITMGYNNLDYLVVEFDRPTSSLTGFYLRAVTDWASESPDANVEVLPKDNMAQPFCKTIFIPLPKNAENMANDLVAFQILPVFKTHSVTHIARTYLASKDYLLEKGYSEEELANGIYGEGESVTIGNTGYATIFFPGAWDHYVPGGLKGYDYTYEYELNSGVPPVLSVDHEYVADEKVNGDYAAVLKAEATVKLPYTFYFPKAETEQQGTYKHGYYPCLFGTEEEGETINMIGPSQVRYYKLSTKNGKNVGFYWGAPDGGPFINGAKKAYLILPNYEAYEAANGYVFDENMNLVPDGTTGITDIANDTNSNAPAYNLSGQRVGASYRGIVIQNGKKTTRK